MVLINKAINEITVKLVYYGPGLCGKTTNLEKIYGNPKLEKQREDDLDVDGDGPHALLRLHADGARHDRRPESARAALHGAGPGLLRRDAQARAARCGRRGV